MHNTFGNNIRVSVFGQSHAPCIGVSIEGLPPGMKIDTEALQSFMDRRRPGVSPYATKRQESDAVNFVAGLSNGVTCGAPLVAVIRNTDAHSRDYDRLKDVPRPAHADYTAFMKFGGYNDIRGGGPFSGRMTAPLCIAGFLCMQLLEKQGIRIGAHIRSIKDIWDDAFDPLLSAFAPMDAHFPVLNAAKGVQMQAEIENARLSADSVGGTIECAILGVQVGVGEPMFCGIENHLAQILFAIPAVKGIEFGNGFEAARLYGSENNDAFYYDGDTVKTKTNRHGGALGGIASGMPILFRIAVKPTPSIGIPQESVDLRAHTSASLTVGGRHDPCIVPRAVPCVEAAAAIAIYDLFLESKKGA